MTASVTSTWTRRRVPAPPVRVQAVSAPTSTAAQMTGAIAALSMPVSAPAGRDSLAVAPSSCGAAGDRSSIAVALDIR